MKNTIITIISFFLLLSGCAFFGSNKIGHIQVYSSDIGVMNWEDANIACKKLGEGWRLPTISELELIDDNDDELKGFFKNSYYWSSTENEDGKIFVINIGSIFGSALELRVLGNYNASNKSEKHYVRPVRTLNSEEIKKEYGSKKCSECGKKIFYGDDFYKAIKIKTSTDETPKITEVSDAIFWLNKKNYEKLYNENWSNKLMEIFCKKTCINKYYREKNIQLIDVFPSAN
jgi:hypothetical protein